VSCRERGLWRFLFVRTTALPVMMQAWTVAAERKARAEKIERGWWLISWKGHHRRIEGDWKENELISPSILFNPPGISGHQISYKSNPKVSSHNPSYWYFPFIFKYLFKRLFSPFHLISNQSTVQLPYILTELFNIFLHQFLTRIPKNMVQITYGIRAGGQAD
jgi:hypothetical protein